MGLTVLKDNPDQEPDECTKYSDNRTDFDIESTISGNGIDLSLAYFCNLLSDASISSNPIFNNIGSAVDIGTKTLRVIRSIDNLDF